MLFKSFIKKSFYPVNAYFLAYFRIAFGSIMLWECLRFFAYGWIDKLYIQPIFHFKYFGFEWIHPWPGIGMYIHFVVLSVLALCIAIGYRYRFCIILFFFAFTYVFLLEQARYLNHLYLVCLLSFWMSFMPASGVLSFDSKRNVSMRQFTVPAWMLWLLQAQFAIVYFYSGIAKITHDWLIKGEPMRMWLAEGVHIPFYGNLILTDEFWVYFFAWGGFVFDIAIVPLLLFRRTRMFALIIATLFHLMNAVLFHIGIFPWLMIAATWILFGLPVQRGFVESFNEISYARKKWIIFFVGLYVFMQLVIPLRYWFVPGNSAWSEQSSRFSWQLMLRHKRGNAEFKVYDPETEEVWTGNINGLLGEWQYLSMLHNPDLILQFSHFLGDLFKIQGHERVVVNVRANVSLNGRPYQLLIDPTVNLYNQKRTLGIQPWVLPLKDK